MEKAYNAPEPHRMNSLRKTPIVFACLAILASGVTVGSLPVAAPQMRATFARCSKDLPLLTQWLLDLSELLRQQWAWTPLMLVPSVVGLVLALPPGRRPGLTATSLLLSIVLIVLSIVTWLALFLPWIGLIDSVGKRVG